MKKFELGKEMSFEDETWYQVLKHIRILASDRIKDRIWIQVYSRVRNRFGNNVRDLVINKIYFDIKKIEREL